MVYKVCSNATGSGGESAHSAVAVLGGSGFVGLNITEALLRLGTRVEIIDLAPPPRPSLAMLAGLSGKLGVSVADVRDGNIIGEILSRRQYGTLVHAAATTAGLKRERMSIREIVDSNLVGLASVLDVLANYRQTRLVYVGSSAVFGMATGAVALSENYPQAPQSLYGITKMSSEWILRRWADLHGQNAVIARLGWVYGSYEHDTGFRDMLSAPYRLALLARAGKAASLSRDARFDWLYGRDAGAAIARLALVSDCRFDVYNIGPGRVWPLSLWCQHLARRFVDFRFSFVEREGPTLELFATEDSPPLDASRFEKEFGPVARLGLSDTFDDYLSHLAGRDSDTCP